jgi:hypothetical protein
MERPAKVGLLVIEEEDEALVGIALRRVGAERPLAIPCFDPQGLS